jgi:hypothetical protein
MQLSFIELIPKEINLSTLSKKSLIETFKKCGNKALKIIKKFRHSGMT